MATKTGVFRYTDTDTGEIREHVGGFDGLIRDYDALQRICGIVAEALGPAVLKAWEES